VNPGEPLLTHEAELDGQAPHVVAVFLKYPVVHVYDNVYPGEPLLVHVA